MGRKKPKGEAEAEPSGSLDELGLVNGTQVRATRVTWDWPGMILRDALNLIDGSKGTGKSSLMATIATALCAGTRLPESKSSGPKGGCLWFGSEEGFGGSVLARWKANGGDAKQLHTVQNGSGDGPGRLIMPYQEDRMRSICLKVKARVMVLDPFTSLGDISLDTRNEGSVRLYLESLARVAADCRVTVLLARHLRKGRSGSLLEHGIGSVGVAAVCRSVLRVERDPSDSAICYIGSVATNSGFSAGVVPYSMVDTKEGVFVVKFGRRENTTLEEVIGNEHEPDERDALEDARRLLRAALKDGPVDAKVLLDECLKNGIGTRTLRSAKAELCIVSKRTGGGKGLVGKWTWQLPAK